MHTLSERLASAVLRHLRSLTTIQTKGTPKARAKKEEKVFLEIDARFERPSNTRGRGRGERGGVERGSRTNYRGRGQRTNGNTPRALDVGDETAFPSLSGGA